MAESATAPPAESTTAPTESETVPPTAPPAQSTTAPTEPTSSVSDKEKIQAEKQGREDPFLSLTTPRWESTLKTIQ